MVPCVVSEFAQSSNRNRVSEFYCIVNRSGFDKPSTYTASPVEACPTLTIDEKGSRSSNALVFQDTHLHESRRLTLPVCSRRNPVRRVALQLPVEFAVAQDAGG